jgi:hypothetical protein
VLIFRIFTFFLYFDFLTQRMKVSDLHSPIPFWIPGKILNFISTVAVFLLWGALSGLIIPSRGAGQPL